MKTKLVFTILLLCIAICLIQGQTTSELFVKLPESSFFSLTVSDRLDLVDLYKAGEKAIVKNRFNETCSILHMTDDYLQIRTNQYTIELFLLTLINDTKIIGLIQTVCAPVCDSQLEFFTTSWKKLTTSVFITFAGKYDFLKDGVHPEEEIVKNALIPLDISLMQLNYDPEKQELRQYYKTPDYLGEPDRIKVTPYLKETPKRFKWNQTRFE
jgi:hypothetical protein